MVNTQEFKNKIESILSQEYRIEFLGSNFDEIVHLLTDMNAEKIYSWLHEVMEKKVQPIVTGSKKTYKS